MKIQQINQYLTQYQGVGSKYSQREALSSINSGGDVQNEEGSAELAPLTRINSYTAPVGVKTGINEPEIHEETGDKNIEIHDRKIKEMENTLKKLGINGKLTRSSMQSVPQNFTMHYIEMADANKPNMVIIELENGEFVFEETSLDGESCFNSLGDFLNTAKTKLSAEEMKKMFAEFFNVDKLKNLFDEFLES